MPFTCTMVMLATALSAPPANNPADQASTDPAHQKHFEAKIRPMLINHCLRCHGGEKTEGGFRVDDRAAFFKGGDSGHAVVPGSIEKSYLMERILAKDADLRMPPDHKLSADQIKELSLWVKQGTAWPTSMKAGQMNPTSPEGLKFARENHWAFQPIQRPPLPAVQKGDWSHNAVDRFVLAQLEKQGLHPSPQADRRTLIRRVTYTLTGLEPTPTQVSAFEKDPRPDAYERLVDRLLASPAYGERWGRHWLDVARYADTQGYLLDRDRRFPFAYTYRDWVIQALNDDRPFKEFVTQQLASDLTPQTKSAPQASPDLAALGFLTVGRKFRGREHEVIDDQIDVTTRGFLGMTVTCARCHHHKYDAVPTDDYYSLFGVFHSIKEPSPGSMPVIDHRKERPGGARFDAQLAKRQKAVADFRESVFRKAEAEAQAHARDFLLYVTLERQGKRPSSLRTKWGEMRRGVIDHFRVGLRIQNARKHPVLWIWADLMAFKPRKDFGFTDRLQRVLDEAGKPKGRSLPQPLIDRLLAKKPGDMVALTTILGQVIEEADQHKTDKAWAGLQNALHSADGPLPLNRQHTRIYNRNEGNHARKLASQLNKWLVDGPGSPARAMVVNEKDRPFHPHIFRRGNPAAGGPKVPRRFLQVLEPMVGGSKFNDTNSGRLELAQAITHPKNPLAARVWVNRLWQHHFGVGLVSTPSDFGVRGALPSHPELLDYLARRFLDNGGRSKDIHRLLVTSATFRQASVERPGPRQKDPSNVLLWRMNRHRKDWESLHDSLLQVSRGLNRSVGGPSQPLFGQKATHRKAVYGFIDRQDLPNTLRTFDLASPDVSTAARPKTTVPQQTLYMMNSPFVWRQALQLAQRPVISRSAKPDDKVEALYRQLFARRPDDTERASALKFLRSAGTEPSQQHQAVHRLALALLMTNEFAFVD